MQRGAICWQVILEDSNQNTDCYLGVSVDTIVLIEEHSRQIVFVTPCVSVLGWHAQTNRCVAPSIPLHSTRIAHMNFLDD